MKKISVILILLTLMLQNYGDTIPIYQRELWGHHTYFSDEHLRGGGTTNGKTSERALSELFVIESKCVSISNLYLESILPGGSLPPRK